MNREFLESLKSGESTLTKEAVDSIMAEYGKSVTGLKTQIDTLMGENATLKNNAEAAKAGELDGLRQQHQTELDNLKSGFTDKITKMAVNYKVKLSGAKNAEDIISQLDNSKITYDEESGKVSGIDEQIESLKANKKYLFEEATKEPSASGLEHGNSKTEDVTADARVRKIMGLPEKRKE